MTKQTVTTATPQLTEIVLHRASHALEVVFEDGERFKLPWEYLRVHSPSAEVQGHGGGQQVLVPGKRNVSVDAIEPVGHYGILLRFDDGHDTGIFAWPTLHALGRGYAKNWQAYLNALELAGLSRER